MGEDDDHDHEEEAVEGAEAENGADEEEKEKWVGGESDRGRRKGRGGGTTFRLTIFRGGIGLFLASLRILAIVVSPISTMSTYEYMYADYNRPGWV